MGVPGFGHGTLLASLARGVFRGNQPQEFHQFSWILKTREVAKFGHYGDGHSELHPAQGLQGLDHRVQTPGFDLLLELLVEPLEAFGMLLNRTDVFLKDDLLSRGGTDDLREPPQVGRAPIRLAGADVPTSQLDFSCCIQ